MADNKKYGLLQKLSSPYRLAVLSDTDLEEKAVVKTTPLWIFLIFLLISIIIMILSFLLIAYTPLNEHVPGKTKLETKKELLRMSLEVDSLIVLSQQRDLYLNNLKTILSGGVPSQESSQNLLVDSDPKGGLERSKADSLFRVKVEEKSSGDYVSGTENNIVYFFPPIVGELIQGYSISENHFGVDIVAEKNAFISSVDDGRVILSDWTRETGFVIGVHHNNGFLSLYKHNSKLLKTVGDFVRVGDPIAVIGNSGEITSGPHLHFELWKNGESVNPINYISF